MPENKFVHLNNPSANNEGFNRKRGYKVVVDNDEQDNTPKFIKEFQKDKLRRNSAEFFVKRRRRNEARTFQFPVVIDLVKISFFSIFKDNLPALFSKRYGLEAIEYSHFNRTITFEVLEPGLFTVFLAHIRTVIESPEETSYESQSFNLIALISSFEFIDSKSRNLTRNREGLLLKLISSSNRVYLTQKNALLQYLREHEINHQHNNATPDLIEIAQITHEDRSLIADNFDIVRAITSTRALRIRPGTFGEVRRNYGFTLEMPDNLTVVGIIDTGVESIAPLRPAITNIQFDHTGQGAGWDESGHGTSVAGLVVIGEDFCRTPNNTYEAKAKIAVIKALHWENDALSISSIVADIRRAKREHNIRIFNMSLNLPMAKPYNGAYSHFAYELDKVAYEEDVLLLISVGNMDAAYLEEATVTEPHPDHEYPVFFYNIMDNTSPFHSCDLTNICEPAESLNNLSVGALAGNLEDGHHGDISPGSEYPAYYTRKCHYDFDQPVNGQQLSRTQRNKFLYKPDLVFQGGDLFAEQAGLEVLRSPQHPAGGYYARSSGTSLATPLLTSYAAQLLNKYPELRTQTIKALLINSATYRKAHQIPEFRHMPDTLLKKLVGFGRPESGKLFETADNSILFVVEDSIDVEEIIMIPIYLPDYLREANNKLRFEITLCYSFRPVKDNHLNYLPLHISFNLIKAVDINIVANEPAAASAIKAGITWSEDHFALEGRLFSNAQSVDFNLQPTDLEKLNGAPIALAVRCLLKSTIPEVDSAHAKSTRHNFSIVVRITELEKMHFERNVLYGEMIACNEVRNIATAIGDADAALDV